MLVPETIAPIGFSFIYSHHTYTGLRLHDARDTCW